MPQKVVRTCTHMHACMHAHARSHTLSGKYPQQPPQLPEDLQRGLQSSKEGDLLVPALKPRLAEQACSACSMPVCTRACTRTCKVQRMRRPMVVLASGPISEFQEWGRGLLLLPIPPPWGSRHPEVGWGPHRRGYWFGKLLGGLLLPVRTPVLGRAGFPSQPPSHSVQGATGGGSWTGRWHPKPGTSLLPSPCTHPRP